MVNFERARALYSAANDVAKNPDYVLTLEDIGSWEKRHGMVPQGAFVAMRAFLDGFV